MTVSTEYKTYEISHMPGNRSIVGLQSKQDCVQIAQVLAAWYGGTWEVIEAVQSRKTIGEYGGPER